MFSRLKFTLVVGFICLAVTSVRAELSLGQLRVKFENAVEREIEELDAQSLRLKEGYSGALERLKVTLGKEDKLDKATQVLGEIEMLEASEEMKELPDNVDYRLKVMRSKWEVAQKKLDDGHQDKIAGLAKTYLKVLEERKRTLTRGGKIREALVVEEEAKRVGGIAAVAEALDKKQAHGMLRGKYGEGNLALEKNGSKGFAPNSAEKMIDGNVDDYKAVREGCAWGFSPCEFSVKLAKLHVVSKIRILLWDHDARRYRYVLEVSPDQKNWSIVDDHEKRPTDSGWRNVEFKPRDVRYIRLKAFDNTVNNAFPLVELEAYSPKR